MARESKDCPTERSQGAAAAASLVSDRTACREAVVWCWMGQCAPSALRPTAGFCPRIPGELLNTLEGHTDGVTSVCVTADGETVVSGSFDKTVRLWRRSTGVYLCAHLRVGPFAKGTDLGGDGGSGSRVIAGGSGGQTWYR